MKNLKKLVSVKENFAKFVFQGSSDEQEKFSSVSVITNNVEKAEGEIEEKSDNIFKRIRLVLSKNFGKLQERNEASRFSKEIYEKLMNEYSGLSKISKNHIREGFSQPSKPTDLELRAFTSLNYEDDLDLLRNIVGKLAYDSNCKVLIKEPDQEKFVSLKKWIRRYLDSGGDPKGKRRKVENWKRYKKLPYGEGVDIEAFKLFLPGKIGFTIFSSHTHSDGTKVLNFRIPESPRLMKNKDDRYKDKEICFDGDFFK